MFMLKKESVKYNIFQLNDKKRMKIKFDVV